MTISYLRIAVLGVAASLPLAAQQLSPGPQPQPGSSPQPTTPQQTNPESGAGTNAVPVPSTPNSPEVSNPDLRPITGRLENKIDTSSAKAGDSVVVKTTQKATTSGGIEIPEGSRIVGHITEVQAQGQGAENSHVTIQFDQAQLKGGQNLPIRSVIEQVSPASEAGGGSVVASPAPATSATPSNPSTGQSSPQQPSGPSPAGGPPAGTVVARSGNVVIRTTALPGVFLAGNANGQPFSNAAGALLGAKQDVRLDGGTLMTVAIITTPPTVNGR